MENDRNPGRRFGYENRKSSGNCGNQNGKWDSRYGLSNLGNFRRPDGVYAELDGVKDDIVKRFEDWANDLKVYVEKLEEFR